MFRGECFFGAVEEGVGIGLTVVILILAQTPMVDTTEISQQDLFQKIEAQQLPHHLLQVS